MGHSLYVGVTLRHACDNTHVCTIVIEVASSRSEDNEYTTNQQPTSNSSAIAACAR
jgi:hypothetical protein